MNYVDVKTARKRQVKEIGSKKKGPFSYLLITIIVLAIVAVAANAAKIKTALAGMLNPISIVTSVTGNSNSKLKDTDGRTNILILGSDQRDFGAQAGSQLTDTIMLVSVGKSEKDAVLISIPRDLWVESSTGGKYKINELYGSYNGKYGISNYTGSVVTTGTEEIVRAVENVLGIPVHYYGVVNFSLFKEAVDILGGITVNVETSFIDASYPIEGKENAPENERYETISFTKGPIKMDGELALKYSRSRHGDNGENTDFARARRQQNVIMAVKEKALSPQTLLDFSKVKSLYDLYSSHVDTNLDLASLQLFYTLAQSSGFSNIRTLVLDDRSEGENGGLLYAPTDLTLYEGKYVLIPKAGDYTQIHAYIQKYLFY